mmetsp:Transcript_42880/g.133894  ORF Transcript_42880/g.133894 Transcript_42880/m.133894 type:complete len:261 (-) Transcript_42880:86-868(-)
MAPGAELNVTNFNALVLKSEGRDKLARAAQYAARMIVGLTQMGHLQAGTRIYWVNELAGNIMKQLASARRAHRWCKEFPVIQSIVQSLPGEIPDRSSLSFREVADGALELAQRVTLASFMLIDHVGWLKQVKLLSGGERAGTGTIQLGLKFFGASNFLSVLVQLRKLRDARRTEEGTAGAQKQQFLAKNAFKHGLLVIQCAHLSRTYETHDAFVGFIGVISSVMDMLTQWPEKKALPPPPRAVPEEKVSPDAKAPMPAAR